MATGHSARSMKADVSLGRGALGGLLATMLVAGGLFGAAVTAQLGSVQGSQGVPRAAVSQQSQSLPRVVSWIEQRNR